MGVIRRIYLDHTATTPLDPSVRAAMEPFFSETFGNASSVHWYGRQAKSALEKARETIAGAIGAQSGELFFTSGGTESDNLALRGVSHAALQRGKNHIVTSAAEHHAILEPCEQLQKEGIEVTVLPVDIHGLVSHEQVGASLNARTALVSIMHGSNEVGSISPMREIVRVAHEQGALVHTDAVQTVGKIPVNVGELGVDLMTFSAHKMYGPKGIGALYVKKGVEIDPLLFGGGQERGKRPGTENIALAVGFGAAIDVAIKTMESESSRLRHLRDMLENEIKSHFPAALVNGHPTERLPQILNISFDSGKIQLEGEMLLMNMDLHGIAVTSGSACTSGSMQPSHVLLAMGRDARTAKATLRFAFGKSNTEDDIAVVVETLGTVLRQMASVR